jgi:hypothetical protein
MVRAKFRVSSVSTTSYGPGTQDQSAVEMSAVTDDSNKTWSKWTPSGSVKMTINNPDAMGQFKPGMTFFLDFTEAPAKEADEKVPA